MERAESFRRADARVHGSGPASGRLYLLWYCDTEQGYAAAAQSQAFDALLAWSVERRNYHSTTVIQPALLCLIFNYYIFGGMKAENHARSLPSASA